MIQPALYAYFTNLTGCACLDGFELEIDFDPASDWWTKLLAGGAPCHGGETVALTVACVGGQFSIVSGGCGDVAFGAGPPTSVSCDPFQVVFSPVTLGAGLGGCCVGSFQIIILA